MFQSGYIIAGCSTLIRQAERVSSIQPRIINDFLKKNSSGIMCCYGSSFDQIKNYDKHFNKFCKDIEGHKTGGYINDLEYYIDSGGFQVLMGKLNNYQVDKLFNYYYKFLAERSDLYTKGFMLDLPPNDSLYNSWDDLYKYNKRSFKIALDLPKEVIDKLVYVHHFVDNKTSETFSNLFDEFDVMNNFKNYSVGGIVKNEFGHSSVYKGYVPAIIFYLNKAIENNRKELTVHFLGAGACAFQTLLYYKFIELHIKKIFGIDFKITHDSAMYKKICLSKLFMYYDDSNINNISFKSKKLHMKKDGDTIEDIIKDTLTNFAKRNNMDIGHDMTIYNEDDKSNAVTLLYMFLHDIEFVAQVTRVCEVVAEELYPIYEIGDQESFINELSKAVRRFYNNKFKGKQKEFCFELFSNLDYIKNVDLEYASHITNICSNKPDIYNEGVLTF